MRKMIIKDLREFDETVTFPKDEKVKYLTEFEISTEIHLPNQIKSLLEDVEADKKLIFKQGQGEDLLVEKFSYLGFVYVESFK